MPAQTGTGTFTEENTSLDKYNLFYCFSFSASLTFAFSFPGLFQDCFVFLFLMEHHSFDIAETLLKSLLCSKTCLTSTSVVSCSPTSLRTGSNLQSCPSANSWQILRPNAFLGTKYFIKIRVNSKLISCSSNVVLLGFHHCNYCAISMSFVSCVLLSSKSGVT